MSTEVRGYHYDNLVGGYFNTDHESWLGTDALGQPVIDLGHNSAVRLPVSSEMNLEVTMTFCTLFGGLTQGNDVMLYHIADSRASEFGAALRHSQAWGVRPASQFAVIQNRTWESALSLNKKSNYLSENDEVLTPAKLWLAGVPAARIVSVGHKPNKNIPHATADTPLIAVSVSRGRVAVDSIVPYAKREIIDTKKS